MHRFFSDNIDVENGLAMLGEEDSAHACRVLRLRAGDSVVLCDGNGAEYDAEITDASKSGVRLKILSARLCDTEPEIKVTLIQCLPKSGKMELIIQKCVELGAYAFIPVQSERCVVRHDSNDGDGKGKAGGRSDRYNRVSYEAAKQARRGIVPKVYPATVFDKIDFSNFDAVILAYEDESKTTLKQLLEKLGEEKVNLGSIALIVGPEGGFEPCEVDKLTLRGAYSVSLGKRILRTETAGMAMLAMLLYALE